MAQAGSKTLKLALPKGSMQEGVFSLLSGAGIELRESPRGYRPLISLEDCQVKVLKPQNIVEMLAASSRDLGFAGADWVAELDGNLVEVLDTGLDPVRIVAAAPAEILEEGRLPRRKLLVASEYERLTRRWIRRMELDASFVRSYGATEAFPPEDADCIVDNTATGGTLRANGLRVVDDLMASSTRLYASVQAMGEPARRARVEAFALLIRSVLEARSRVMLELNVPAERLEQVASEIPCMREPTISRLHGGAGYAVKAAVPRRSLSALIPKLKAQGGSDIVVSEVAQIVP